MYGRDVCNGHHHHKVYKIKKLDFSIRTFNQVVERSTKAPAALFGRPQGWRKEVPHR